MRMNWSEIDYRSTEKEQENQLCMCDYLFLLYRRQKERGTITDDCKNKQQLNNLKQAII